MPRNKEAHLSGLNRMQLLRERQERAKKAPPRPALSQLKTAADVRKWLPNLQRDIEITLGLTKCVSYHDKKVSELYANLDRLQAELDGFLKKLQRLEGSAYVPPGQPRPYVSSGAKARSNLALPEVLPIVANDPKAKKVPLEETQLKEDPNEAPLVFCREPLVNYSDSD